MEMTSDVLIIGSGIAALAVAEQLCHMGNVIIITKKRVHTNNSSLAQGGVAAVIGEEDSYISHYEDTIRAGCYYNHQSHTEILVREGKEAISELMTSGMKFDEDERGNLLLGMEGAHSHKRILHAGGDATGARIFKELWHRVKDYVTYIEHVTAIDVILEDGKCIGIIGMDEQGNVCRFYGSNTVLATGGLGGLYQYQSNASTATGDGIGIAYRAGCTITDMEFVQFHPTLLFVDGEAKGLVSEAVRGEGARIVTKSGRRIMEGIHPLEDLAPRDVVARQIFLEQKQGNQLYLDVSMIVGFKHHFPTINQLCIENGIHPSLDLIPITPGAHFFMGGIVTNEYGQTSVPNLYAVGEVACTGVHGANRLASNSLLECLVFGKRAGKHISMNLRKFVEESTYAHSFDLKIRYPSKIQLQQKMMRYVGIVRTEKELGLMKKWLDSFMKLDDLKSPLPIHQLDAQTIEGINMLTVSHLIVNHAILRKESIGAHYRKDGMRELKEEFTGEVQVRCMN